MYRFNRRFARVLLVYLTFMRDKGIPYREIVNYAGRYVKPNEDEQGNPVQLTPHEAAISGAVYSGETMELGEMVEILSGQLSTPPEKTNLLIDKLADVVLNPFGASYFGHSTVAGIRNAILNPDEIDGLVEKLKKKEMHCLKCSRKFNDGEMITHTYQVFNGTVVSGFFCSLCKTPTTTRCGTKECKNNVPLLKKIVNPLSRNRPCEECVNRKAKGEIIPKPEVETELETGVLYDNTPPTRPEQAARGAWTGLRRNAPRTENAPAYTVVTTQPPRPRIVIERRPEALNELMNWERATNTLGLEETERLVGVVHTETNQLDPERG